MISKYARLIAGLMLGLIVSFSLHAKGPGPGMKVKNPPPADGKGASAPEGLKSAWTGTCPVLIRDHYNREEWDEHSRCASGWGWQPQLVTIRNDGPVPVFVNEWYGLDWHGQTTILPGKAVVMPVYDSPLSTSLYIGACWPGPGGPGTCQSGTRNTFANVEIVGWQPVSHSYDDYLFTRDESAKGLPASRASSYTAVNLGDYAVQLHWAELGRDRWVELPLKGRIEKIPPGDVKGKKDFGTGAVALVEFIPIPRERGENIYRLLTPSERSGFPPFAFMTLLNGSWCSVELENLGPKMVIMHSWIVPLYIPGGNNLTLHKGAKGTLIMKSGTTLITGHVGTGATGEFTLVKATNWRQCR